MTTENLIVIKGGAYNDIKKALRQWIDIYSKDLPNGLTFQLFKNGRGKHIIQADKRLDNERFYYLINYLNYPENIQYKIDIEGYTTGNVNDNLQNKNLLVYIPPTDKDFDNVFITTSENKNFKFDFGGNILELNEGRKYQTPDINYFDNPEIVVLDKNENTRHQKEAQKNNIDKRFKIISCIAIALFLLSLLTSFYDTKTFVKATFFFGMGLGLWFFSDYKMLQSDKYYIYGLIISVVFLKYSILVKKELNRNSLDFVDLGAFYPLTVLITQWPTRKIYLAIFKREPKVDKYGKFADLIYTLILFLGFAVLPLLIMDKLR